MQKEDIDKKQRDRIKLLLSSLGNIEDQIAIEQQLKATFKQMPDAIFPNEKTFHNILNYYLHHYILKHYKYQEENVCIWRFIKNLSIEEIQTTQNPALTLLDHLIRIYFYSEPLDDLHCIFIPITNHELLEKYLAWVKSYFYAVNYPTSLLWFYALDSSVIKLLPDEIIYLGRRTQDRHTNIIYPDYSYQDAILIKRYSDQEDDFIVLEKDQANKEFKQLFGFLGKNYRDRCLSHSGKHSLKKEGLFEYKNFEDVLKFGVSDRAEEGCISFSDMRASTEFLNFYGKNVYLNKIQHPFFESTKLINQQFSGSIDKFMGDNVMCTFLSFNMPSENRSEKTRLAILNNLCAIIQLCRVLYNILKENKFSPSLLGLRSGISYGQKILRSNLGNEIVRDYTVTGETVNLSARLEQIAYQELELHNRNYFKKTIERFPEINALLSVTKDTRILNDSIRKEIDTYTLYQNIISNIKFLEKFDFDIRLNQGFYIKLRSYLLQQGHTLLNPKTTHIHGYESFKINNFTLNFYFLYYNPKGFKEFEKIWILALDKTLLENMELKDLVYPK